MKSRITSALLIAAGVLLAGCAGVVAAQTIKAVSETVSGNAIQHKTITASELSQLATDLSALPQTPLPSKDNVLIANIISEATAKKAADLTAASAVDAINNALGQIIQGHAPTVADGIAWANLQDVIQGMQAEVKLLAENPRLATSALYSRPAANPNGLYAADVFRR